mmetsp:Transcript_5183/g.17002  ORF Transcript_5183/g.17002 Transcript_5183/m.17002 type:complete len:213 (-) Transcript_5183:262-900(-)
MRHARQASRRYERVEDAGRAADVQSLRRRVIHRVRDVIERREAGLVVGSRLRNQGEFEKVCNDCWSKTWQAVLRLEPDLGQGPKGSPAEERIFRTTRLRYRLDGDKEACLQERVRDGVLAVGPGDGVEQGAAGLEAYFRAPSDARGEIRDRAADHWHEGIERPLGDEVYGATTQRRDGDARPLRRAGRALGRETARARVAAAAASERCDEAP